MATRPSEMILRAGSKRAGRSLGLALLAACAFSACGSQASAEQQQGRAAGESLVCFFDQVKYPTVMVLAQDFRAWVKGGGSNVEPRPCPPAPSRALSPSARTAAAHVVLGWVARNAARFGESAGALISYLRSHGVS